MKRYWPILKTSDAELQGLLRLSDEVKGKITPLIELTKSRNTKLVPQGDVFRRLESFKEAFTSEKRFSLDLTTNDKLLNDQIRQLQNPSNGYKYWVEFISLIKKTFPRIVPVLQALDDATESEEEYKKIFKSQVKNLGKSCRHIVYRMSADFDDYAYDFDLISETENLEKLVCVIDATDIVKNSARAHAEQISKTVRDMLHLGVENIIVAASSFPQNPTAYGGDDYGIFNIEEVILFEELKRLHNSGVIYSDYASVYPLPNLREGGGGGIPRIDLPTKKKMLYYRSRKHTKEDTYRDAYIRCANKVIVDEHFELIKKFTHNCWGIQQIESAARGEPQGLHPSFWIAVRINIHITVQAIMRSNTVG